MKKVTLLFVGAIATTLLIFGCKKTETAEASKESLLVGKNWMMTSATLVSPGGNIDVYATMDDCEKDDLEIYNADKTVTDKPGATKCDPAEAASTPAGKWSLNGSSLTVINAGDTNTMNITAITATSMSLEQSETTGGVTITAKATFIAK